MHNKTNKNNWVGIEVNVYDNTLRIRSEIGFTNKKQNKW